MSNFDKFIEQPLAGQGFEIGPDDRPYSNDVEDDSESPVFSLGVVQFSLPSTLHALSCTSNILILAVIGHPRPASSDRGGKSPQLIRIDLGRPSETETIDLAIPPPTLSRDGSFVSCLHKVHVDPTGRHVIVSTITGDNFYVFIGTLPSGVSPSRKAKALNRLKGAVIESVAWSSSASMTTFSTKEILLGTANGHILETVLLDPTLSESSAFSLPVPGRSGAPERYVKQIYALGERDAVTGLSCEIWGRRAIIFIATKTRLYQFVGSLSSKREDEGGILEAMMQPYNLGEVQPKSLELPGEPPNSELHFFAHPRIGSDGIPTGASLPKSVAWLTGPGIYHGRLTFPSSSADRLHFGDGIIESASLVPYPSEPTAATHLNQSTFVNEDNSDEDEGSEIPISMALTEWNMILLYEDRIRIVGLLSDKVVFEEMLELRVDERPLRLSTDLLRRTYWLHTDQSIFELVIKDEDRDVWKIYLARSNWEEALRHAKTPRHRDIINAAQADAFFAAGRYIQSAQSYASSSKSFEEVVLRFVDKNERDALRYYLISKLECLRKTDLTQRMMLATWLIEIFLSKISQLEDIAAAERASEDVENYTIEETIVEEDMRHFLKTYKNDLDPRTIFDLIASHGRDEMGLHYASIVGDHERIVTYWILEENWLKAIVALSSQDDLELYYRFATALVRYSPKEAVEMFMRQATLDVRRLIPSFASPRNAPSTSRSLSTLHGIRYLQYSILELRNTDPAVHNTLLTLYASDSSVEETELITFLSSSPDDPITGSPYYDLDYALRLCRTNKRVRACVLIYSKMGLYESSVDLALENEDLELAKDNADKPIEDDILRKKLWLKIAKYVVAQKNDIKTAMRFLESTDLLKIEDILPFFPDFVVIDDFKDEICTALEGYSAHIEQLKEDMTESTKSAEAIKADIADLKNRFVVVQPNERCSSCGLALLTRQFYVFPCQHTFHADCLINEVTKHLSPVALRRMLDLQSQLTAFTSSTKSRRPVEDTQTQGRKLAAASVQGLDQLRKLVLPNALLSIIGDALPGTRTIRETNGSEARVVNNSNGNGNGYANDTVASSSRNEESKEMKKLKEALDTLLASSCVLCDAAITSVDRAFVGEGESM